MAPNQPAGLWDGIAAGTPMHARDGCSSGCEGDSGNEDGGIRTDGQEISRTECPGACSASRRIKSKRFKRIKHAAQCFTGQARWRWHSLCDGTLGAKWRLLGGSVAQECVLPGEGASVDRLSGVGAGRDEWMMTRVQGRAGGSRFGVEETSPESRPYESRPRSRTPETDWLCRVFCFQLFFLFFRSRRIVPPELGGQV